MTNTLIPTYKYFIFNYLEFSRLLIDRFFLTKKNKIQFRLDKTSIFSQIETISTKLYLFTINELKNLPYYRLIIKKIFKPLIDRSDYYGFISKSKCYFRIYLFSFLFSTIVDFI